MLESLNLHGDESDRVEIIPSTYLPERGSLRNLNLDGELYDAYSRAKNYLVDVQSDPDIPPNQVAQCMNTLSAILKEIVKMQVELHSAERVKRLEQAMIAALKTVPNDTQNLFFAEFARLSEAA